VIESGLERFVFNEQALTGRQVGVRLFQYFGEPLFALADVRGTKDSSIRRQTTSKYRGCAVAARSQYCLWYAAMRAGEWRDRIAERTELIFLILKKIRD